MSKTCHPQRNGLERGTSFKNFALTLLTNHLLGAVFVEKLSLLQPVEKCSSFYGKRNSCTLFTGTPPPGPYPEPK